MRERASNIALPAMSLAFVLTFDEQRSADETQLFPLFVIL